MKDVLESEDDQSSAVSIIHISMKDVLNGENDQSSVLYQKINNGGRTNVQSLIVRIDII